MLQDVSIFFKNDILGIRWTFARIPLAMSGAIRRLHYIKLMKKLFSITFLSASVRQSSNYENCLLRLYAVASSHLLTSFKKGKLQLTLTRMLSCFLPIPTHHPPSRRVKVDFCLHNFIPSGSDWVWPRICEWIGSTFVMITPGTSAVLTRGWRTTRIGSSEQRVVRAGNLMTR